MPPRASAARPARPANSLDEITLHTAALQAAASRSSACLNLLSRSAAYLERHAARPSAPLAARAVSDAADATQLSPRLPASWLALFSAHVAAGNPAEAANALDTGLHFCPRDHALRYARASLQDFSDEEEEGEVVQQERYAVEAAQEGEGVEEDNNPHLQTRTEQAALRTPDPLTSSTVTLARDVGVDSCGTLPSDRFPPRSTSTSASRPRSQPSSARATSPSPSLSENSDPALLRAAEHSLAAGAFQDAIAKYTTVVRRGARAEPTSSYLHALCGRSDAWLRKARQADDDACYARAAADARRLVEHAPSWDHAWLRLGAAHLENGCPARAKHSFRRGLLACPTSLRLREGLRDAQLVIETEGPESDWEEDRAVSSAGALALSSSSGDECYEDALDGYEQRNFAPGGSAGNVVPDAVETPAEPLHNVAGQSRNTLSSALERHRRESEMREREVQLRTAARERRAIEREALAREAQEREAREIAAREREDREREAHERDVREREAREQEKRQGQGKQCEEREKDPSSSATVVSHQKLYDLLQVPRTANEASIKRSYYNLARIYHPDKNQDDSQAKDKFQKIAEAYAVLSDPKSRAVYDKYGDKGLMKNSVDMIDPSTLFAMVFGSDRFVHLIGELELASVASNVDENGNTPTNVVLKTIQKARVGKLVLEMVKTLKPWVDGDKRGFLSGVHRQMRRLRQASFGPSLLHIVGDVYVQYTSYLLDKTRPFKQISAMMRKASLRSHRIASQHKAMTAAGRVMEKQRRLYDRVKKSGRDNHAISREEVTDIAVDMAQNAIDMMWKISVVDIETTLEEVLNIVLSGRDLVADAEAAESPDAARASEEDVERSRPWLRIGSPLGKDGRGDRPRENNESVEVGLVRPGTPLKHGEAAVTRQQILSERAYGIQAMGRVFTSAL